MGAGDDWKKWLGTLSLEEQQQAVASEMESIRADKSRHDQYLQIAKLQERGKQLQAGADIIRMRHPRAVTTVKNFINQIWD